MEAVAKLYTINKGLVERARSYQEKTGITITEFAKEINYSRTALSQFLGGKYEPKNSDIESRVEAFLREKTGELGSHSEIEAAPRKVAFLESTDAINIIGVCRAAQEFTGLGIIVGRSGFGKTKALEYYANLPKVAYVECDDTMGQRDLVKAIERTIGIPTGYGSIWERVNGIRAFFNSNQGYLLIVDEADKLVSKYTQKKMEILRAIYDQSDVGLIIAGEPKLEATIKGHLARFANRVDFYATLKGLSRKEVENFLAPFDFEDAALAEMVARATNPHTGCFRLMDRTLNNVLRISNGKRITPDMIAKASNMMML